MAKTKAEIEWERSQLRLHYAADTRKFEIQLFWQRSLYFWGLVAAALVAYATLHKDARDSETHLLCVFVICFGFLTSFAWSLQSRGGKYWHEAWEQKIHKIEEDVLSDRLFWNEEPSLPKQPNIRDAWLRSRRYSVSKIAIAMADFSVVLWIGLAVSESNLRQSDELDWAIIGSYLVAAILGTALFFLARSKPPAEH